jgi:elongation factor Ts
LKAGQGRSDLSTLPVFFPNPELSSKNYFMAEITAAAVGKLREMTNAGMMDCKKALTEAKGDLNAAVDILRKKGAATATSKGAREAREGVVAQYIAPGGRLGVLVEINCQTDFVARNDMFRAFSEDVAKRLAADPKTDFETDRVAMVAKIRENIQIPRHARMEVSDNGLVAAYIHTGAKVGVLVEVGAGKEATVGHEDFKQLVKDITLQIAAGHPVVVSREQAPADVVAKEKEIAGDQVKNKPPQAIAKIVEGKLEKFYQTYCLVDQGFVKKNSEISVKEHVGSVAKQLGDQITIRRFVRFQVGESPATEG